jgi:hypothetical protein
MPFLLLRLSASKETCKPAEKLGGEYTLSNRCHNAHSLIVGLEHHGRGLTIALLPELKHSFRVTWPVIVSTLECWNVNDDGRFRHTAHPSMGHPPSPIQKKINVSRTLLSQRYLAYMRHLYLSQFSKNLMLLIHAADLVEIHLNNRRSPHSRYTSMTVLLCVCPLQVGKLSQLSH